MKNILLSVKPIYGNQILNNIKKVEFRKRIFNELKDHIYIYNSYPEMSIKGYFTVSKIIRDTPQALWNNYHRIGGIDKKDFFNYFQDKDFGFAILIDKVYHLDYPLIPKNYLTGFRPPQSYCYLTDKLQSKLNSIPSYNIY